MDLIIWEHYEQWKSDFPQSFNGSVDNTLEACMVKPRELSLNYTSNYICNRWSVWKGIDETEETLKPRGLLAVVSERNSILKKLFWIHVPDGKE